MRFPINSKSVSPSTSCKALSRPQTTSYFLASHLTSSSVQSQSSPYTSATAHEPRGGSGSPIVDDPLRQVLPEILGVTALEQRDEGVLSIRELHVDVVAFAAVLQQAISKVVVVADGEVLRAARRGDGRLLAFQCRRPKTSRRSHQTSRNY